MSKQKSRKGLDEHIAELEEVMSELRKCAACGKPIEPEGSATCPHCGTPVAEAAELSAKAEESLSDLEKQLAATVSQSTPALAPEPVRAALAPADAARAAAKPSAHEPSLAEKPATTPTASPEGVAEAVESRDLETFIETMEAQVESETAGLEESRAGSAAASKPRRRGGPRSASLHEPRFWVAAIAAGGVLYVVALFLTALLGRVLVASFMILATGLVAAGIRAKPVVRAKQVAKASSKSGDDFVCPLCGTGVPSQSTHCPTCGAIFEGATA